MRNLQNRCHDISFDLPFYKLQQSSVMTYQALAVAELADQPHHEISCINQLCMHCDLLHKETNELRGISSEFEQRDRFN